MHPLLLALALRAGLGGVATVVYTVITPARADGDNDDAGGR